MKLNVFIKEECPHCEMISIPEELNVKLINIDKDYDGYLPESIPVLQVNKLSIPGPEAINALLETIKQAQNDYYKA